MPTASSSIYSNLNLHTDPSLRKTLIESVAFRAGRAYLENEGFIEVFPPRIVRASGACENVDTLFEVRVEGDHKWFQPGGEHVQSYLAQTGQLYLEGFVPQLKKVYCSGPSFRAEEGVDSRHMTEFQMMEIEFEGDFDELLEYIEGFVSTIAHRVAEQAEELGLLEEERQRLQSCPNKFPKITYDEAIGQLKDMGEAIEWGDDIHSQREQMLVQAHGNQPLFITRYPDPMWDFGKEIEVEKFFNMLPDKEHPGRVLSADLILPIAGESVGSAARVDDVQTLVKRLVKSKMFERLVRRGGSLEDFDWYISRSSQKGMVPHAGCGFGMARILQWINGVEDIRESVTFPQNQEILI